MAKARARKKITKNAMIRARTPERLKVAAERVFARLGLSSTEAINLFYAQVCLRHGMPFPVEIPNEETLEVFKKTERAEELNHAENADELFSKLGL